MKLKMDKAGRSVFPKPLRKRLGLGQALELEVVEQPGGVLLRPVAVQPAMVLIDGLWVHCGKAEPGANVERLLSDVREERSQATLKP